MHASNQIVEIMYMQNAASETMKFDAPTATGLKIKFDLLALINRVYKVPVFACAEFNESTQVSAHPANGK